MTRKYDRIITTGGICRLPGATERQPVTASDNVLSGKNSLTGLAGAAEYHRFFSKLIKQSSGIALQENKRYLLDSRLNELAKSMGLSGIKDLYRKAKFSMTPRLKEQIVDALTTNETYFFRDGHPFEAIKTKILPDLMETNRSGRKLRIWSAACSTGQEPYSLAMIITDCFPELSRWKVEITATDISRNAIQKGIAGRFTQVEADRGLPKNYRTRYLKKHENFWLADEKLKKLVRFRRLNLLEPFRMLGTFDLILCRYVLIYFEKTSKQQVLSRLIEVLKPGGYLFLGATETPVGMPSCMKRRIFARAVCWQKRDKKA